VVNAVRSRYGNKECSSRVEDLAHRFEKKDVILANAGDSAEFAEEQRNFRGQLARLKKEQAGLKMCLPNKNKRA
jgi:hypothetical protein